VGVCVCVCVCVGGGGRENARFGHFGLGQLRAFRGLLLTAFLCASESHAST
jgi:hypothetical protein